MNVKVNLLLWCARDDLYIISSNKLNFLEFQTFHKFCYFFSYHRLRKKSHKITKRIFSEGKKSSVKSSTQARCLRYHSSFHYFFKKIKHDSPRHLFSRKWRKILENIFYTLKALNRINVIRSLYIHYVSRWREKMSEEKNYHKQQVASRFSKYLPTIKTTFIHAS